MPNLYCDLGTFKTRLNITGSADDPMLLGLIENTSRAIDEFCDRFFYILEETRHYDGSSSPLVLDQDLLSVTSVKTDDDGSGGSWETAWAASDYELLPYNGQPKYALAVTPWGTKGSFNAGAMKAVEVTGTWGFALDVKDTGATVNESPNFGSADTALTVTDGSQFGPGQTLLIEAEQIFVISISGDVLTVERGVNGTAAVVHDDASSISVHRYPRPVVEACVIRTARLWKRKDSAFTTSANNRRSEPGLDADVRSLLASFRRISVVAI